MRNGYELYSEPNDSMQAYIYSNVADVSDLKRIFSTLRRDVEHAASRAILTSLYRRAIYVIALLSTSAWEKRFGNNIIALQKIGRDEFNRTIRAINLHAKRIGTNPNYSEY
ncbi:MAG: hypothetical protein K0R63_41 [Rickettsiales bacterium]|nr:hypothetical protein [Rickettsiales bacterium]